MNLDQWGKIAQKLRVPGGMVLGIVFLLFMRPTASSLWVGGALAWAGAWLRIWAAGHIEKGKAITQTGPYAFTRNPLYLGSLLMATGILLAGRSYWLLVLFAIFYAVLYFPVMKAEEREMKANFGEAFQEYARRVPLFFPSVFAASLASISASTSFEWARVIRNGEHRAVTGLLLIEAFLWWKVR